MIWGIKKQVHSLLPFSSSAFHPQTQSITTIHSENHHILDLPQSCDPILLARPMIQPKDTSKQTTKCCESVCLPVSETQTRTCTLPPSRTLPLQVPADAFEILSAEVDHQPSLPWQPHSHKSSNGMSLVQSCGSVYCMVAPYSIVLTFVATFLQNFVAIMVNNIIGSMTVHDLIALWCSIFPFHVAWVASCMETCLHVHSALLHLQWTTVCLYLSSVCIAYLNIPIVLKLNTSQALLWCTRDTWR